MGAITPLSRIRAHSLLAKIRNQSILVVGDVMLDKYIRAHSQFKTDESRRETPKYVALEEQVLLGGAGCVMRNVQALGASTTGIGVTGDDARRDELLRLLEEDRINSMVCGKSSIVADGGRSAEGPRPTTLKARVIHNARHVMRCDIEAETPISDAVAMEISRLVELAMPNADAVIIADYDKGVMTPTTITAVIESARKHKVPVFVDPKYRNFNRYRGVFLIKPNRQEIERNLSLPMRHLAPEDEPAVNICERAKAAARQVTRSLSVEHTLLTIGRGGMILDSAGDSPIHYLGLNQAAVDVVGAGDTVIATVAAACAAGASIREAAALASVAARITVSKSGAHPTSATELKDDLWRLEGVAQLDSESGEGTAGK